MFSCLGNEASTFQKPIYAKYSFGESSNAIFSMSYFALSICSLVFVSYQFFDFSQSFREFPLVIVYLRNIMIKKLET